MLGVNLLGSSNSTQDFPVDLALILIVSSYTLPSRKANGLLDSGDNFCRKEEEDYYCLKILVKNETKLFN